MLSRIADQRGGAQIIHALVLEDRDRILTLLSRIVEQNTDQALTLGLIELQFTPWGVVHVRYPDTTAWDEPELSSFHPNEIMECFPIRWQVLSSLRRFFMYPETRLLVIRVNEKSVFLWKVGDDYRYTVASTRFTRIN